MMSNDIGIDLGTASILVYIKGKGVVLKEPSVVAIDRDTNKIMAIGEEARLMIGRTPGNIVAVRPLRQGVISDYTITEKMLKYFISKAVGKKTLRKPRISVCIPSGATEVEKKAVEDATYQAGAREVAIIEEPVAAAIGAGIDIGKACGNMIVDIGGGTADIAVISLGGPVVSTSIKIAGDDFGMNLGVAFQLKDDFLDVYGDAAVFGKNIGGDILCNKKTYMLIKAFEHADEEQLTRLNAWVDAVAFNPEEKVAAVTELYNRIGVKELCEKKMEEYCERAMESLLAVKVADEKKEELKNLMANLMHREV